MQELRTIINSAWWFLRLNWGSISLFGSLGYLFGSLMTRKIMAPSFCPRCLLQKEWQDELRRDAKGRMREDKSVSRYFYQVRKKKDTPPPLQ